LRETLLLSPSLLWVPIFCCHQAIVPSPSFLALLFSSFQEPPQVPKGSPFFSTQGVIKKGVLLGSTPFLGGLSQSDKSYFFKKASWGAAPHCRTRERNSWY